METAEITSDDLNFLIYRYLQESGMIYKANKL